MNLHTIRGGKETKSIKGEKNLEITLHDYSR